MPAEIEANRLASEEPTIRTVDVNLNPGVDNTIDLNDGTSVKLEGDLYVWYDIEGGVQDRFERGTIDFESWSEVHTALRGLAPVG